MMSSPSVMAYNCSPLDSWETTDVYNGGDKIQYNNKAYQANWWTQGNNPEQSSGAYQEWTLLGSCGGSEPPAPDNQPPQTSLTSPANGSTYTTDDSILLQANASDNDGTISKVSFYANNTLLGEDTSAPYAQEWTAVNGRQQLKAVATDNDGGIGT
ncbi:Ig-like domain-containing protein [Endozoicomonas euniceicola]|uniref:Ig-like domain-containing protein n=1 Tax=Endozoicomonas euniceicola TaxID=1234143 RepID=A0ABY6GYN6_9GAMM|nr:Ig-like domain-containing protein [Endozoicomonas euniceicola]UYM17131.1 Ig-like domain-containing protein [Endozoicomonas euniceicola]